MKWADWLGGTNGVEHAESQKPHFLKDGGEYGSKTGTRRERRLLLTGRSHSLRGRVKWDAGIRGFGIVEWGSDIEESRRDRFNPRPGIESPGPGVCSECGFGAK